MQMTLPSCAPISAKVNAYCRSISWPSSVRMSRHSVCSRCGGGASEWGHRQAAFAHPTTDHGYPQNTQESAPQDSPLKNSQVLRVGNRTERSFALIDTDRNNLALLCLKGLVGLSGDLIGLRNGAIHNLRLTANLLPASGSYAPSEAAPWSGPSPSLALPLLGFLVATPPLQGQNPEHAQHQTQNPRQSGADQLA
jgi:hypothetical protein